jgi:ribosome-binding factor A
MQEALSQLPTPVGKLEQLNYEKQLQIEAEIQKKLTKAVPFLRGQICEKLGLRYSPELRFYRDNTVD